MKEPSVTVDLCGGFIFPTCPWVRKATKCWLCLSWVLCCQQRVLRRILPFLVSFQYSTSGVQKIVLPALCTAGFKVQPWPKWACRTPFHATVMWGQGWAIVHFYCLWIACQQYLDSYKKGRKSAGVNLLLIKIYNLASKIGVAVGFRQAAGLVLSVKPGTSFLWKPVQLLLLEFPYTASADRGFQLMLQGI